MIRLFAAFAFIFSLLPHSAHAQAEDAPLTFEFAAPVPLEGAPDADRALAGNTYLLSFAIRNRSALPVRLRRIAFRLQPGLELVDPNIDRLDNNRDGGVDEAGEGFDHVNELALAWRIDDSVDVLQPGDMLERAVKARLLPSAEAGETLSVNMIAVASAENATLRAEKTVPFTLDPPTLSITLDGATSDRDYRASDTPLVQTKVTIPSGRVSDFRLELQGVPAIEGYREARILMGDGLRCDAAPTPVIETRVLIADFGTCQVTGDAASDRTITIEAKAILRDAEPFSDADTVAARRALTIAAKMLRGDAPSGAVESVSGRLTGPLIGVRLVSVSDMPVDAGDAVKATYRIVNRGDTATEGLNLRLSEDSPFECDVTLSGSNAAKNACTTGLALQQLEPRKSRDITLSTRFRDDARLHEATALQLKATGRNLMPTDLPPARFALRTPEGPTIAVKAGHEWDLSGDFITARIGDTGTVEISGELPEGRYQADLLIRARLVDALTGAAAAPAPLAVEGVTFSPSDTIKSAPVGKPSPMRADGDWAVLRLPLNDLAVAVSDTSDGHRFTATATLRVRDAPEFRAGRLIEIAGGLSLFGSTVTRDDDWVEVVVVEPTLDLTVHSTDEDRSVDLHDSVPVAVLTCNRGASSAEAVILKVTMPRGLRLDGLDSARVRTIRSDRAMDSAALFSPTARAVGEVFFDAGARILRGALKDNASLKPGACIALIFDVRRAGIYAPDIMRAEIAASVEPYTGRAGAHARIYSGLHAGSIRFDLPPLRFGPVSEREVGGDHLVSHDVALEIPASAGAHRLSLSIDSSAGLDWTILQIGDDGAPAPWRNGATIPSGKVLRFRFETPNPGALPLGWIDTTLARALAFSETGEPVSATTRLITRRAEALGGKVTVTKTMALDRDCDGEVGDERIQDALFEPVKDAAVGDCVIFHVMFKHSGDKDMERIVVRDRVPAGTVLRPNAVEILRAPEPLQNSEMRAPRPGSSDVVWSFDGLFKPGAEGAVSYAVKLIGDQRN